MKPLAIQKEDSMRIAQLIKDIQNCPCVAKFSERDQNWEEKHQRFQMELIPSYFVRTCNTRMKELAQATQWHLPATKVPKALGNGGASTVGREYIDG